MYQENQWEKIQHAVNDPLCLLPGAGALLPYWHVNVFWRLSRVSASPPGERGDADKKPEEFGMSPCPRGSVVITWLIQCVFVGRGELSVRDQTHTLKC